MSKKIKVSLTESGIDTLIKAVEDYKKWLTQKTAEFLNRIAEEGVKVSSVNFSSAAYDGTNDVTVSLENRGEFTRAVVAVGKAVLFIEFGTGITYPDSHPEAAENGMAHGTYGFKLGRLENGWRYKGDPGTNGEVIATGKHAGEVRTKGNPASMAMYNTVKDLEERFTEIAKEVFV